MSTVTQPRTAPKRMSVEDFLAFYDRRPQGEHWELIDGEAIMMTPPTKVHDRIGANLAYALNRQFELDRRQYFAYQGAGLFVPDADRFRPEADVAVEDAIAAFETYSDRFYLACGIISKVRFHDLQA